MERSPIPEWVYLDNNLILKTEAKISVFDRGFLFADSVYESIPAYFHKLRCLEWHLERLQSSLDKIDIPFNCGSFDWKNVLHTLIKRNKHDHQSIYIQITRGQYIRRCHVLPEPITPTLFISTQPLELFTKSKMFSGYSAITVEDIRWHYTSIKTTNLLPNVLQLNKAAQQNSDEAILIREGKVVEGSCSNIFIVKNNTIITPPLQESMLPGITRRIILMLAEQNSINFEERMIAKDELYHADELWFTNSCDGVAPIVNLDKVVIGNGKGGDMWEKIYDLYINMFAIKDFTTCKI